MPLAAALLTSAWCLAAGRLLVRQWALAFAVGAALVSTLVVLLGLLGWAYPATFAISAALTIAASIATRRPRLHWGWPRLSFWGWAAAAVFLAFGIFYLINAAAPETSADGSGYHLGVVRRYFNAHRMFPIPTSLYAMFPQGMEMLFWVAYAFGRHSAAALVHFATLLTLAAAMIAYGRQFLTAFAGTAAALIVFVTPVVGIDATSAYVDAGLALAGFSVFVLLQLWDTNRENRTLLVAAGLAAGFCFAIKYTGVVAVAYAIGLVAYRARQIRPALLLAAAAALIISPWVIRNWVWYQDPAAPFFDRLFPNPNIRVSIDEEYRQAMRHFNGASLGWTTPVELTLRGGQLQGTLGPVFLLAPIGLLSLRTRQGRQILLAAAIFGAPYFANIGTRFLMPSLPFLALAMVNAVSTWRAAPAALVIIQALASWPGVLKQYCAPYNWRLDRFPAKAALRIEPESAFLEYNFAPWYPITQMVQVKTPANAIIYTAQPLPEAYTDRTIWLNYTAVLPNRVQDLLTAGLEWPDARKQDMAQIRGLGVTHLLIHDAERLGPAMAADPAAWALRIVAKVAPMTLYEINIDTSAQRRNN
jgi:hypothetical protein